MILRLFLGQNAIFRQKKPKKNRPKNCPKMVKNGQNGPKIGEINRGGPPENPNESQKYRKNGQKRSHSAIWKCTKTVKMTKNRQKSANNMKKIDFPYNNFPKKGISLRKCTQKIYFRLRRKKSQNFFSRLRRYTAATPPTGCYRISGF